MSITATECCVLNSGSGAWAFEPLAAQLSSSLGIDVSEEPRRFNYLLHIEDANRIVGHNVFIPIQAIKLASDKRLLASVFLEHRVPTPVTRLFHSFNEALAFIREQSANEWCLKYPTSCGASGHKIVTATSTEPLDWPQPFIIQEFIRLERPEVYRIYCAAAELFGWVVRRFPDGSRVSPWVAHARGARYVRLDDPPAEALEAARHALLATGLLDSFGCVDLLHSSAGKWIILEVGTDGLFNHVDRDIGDASLERELDQRVRSAFWRAVEKNST